MPAERFRWRSYVAAAGLLAGTAAIPILAQAPSPQSAPHAGSPDVVVEGERDPKWLQGGQWRIGLTRSYAFGSGLNPLSNESRPAGRDQSWQMCLADTDIVPLMRLLVGEGRTESSGTTICSRLRVTLGDGNLHADQVCNGVNIYPPTDKFSPPTPEDIAKGRYAPSPGRDVLTITGHYNATTLTVDFDSRRQAYNDSGSLTNGRRWSIKGERIGSCLPGPTTPPR